MCCIGVFYDPGVDEGGDGDVSRAVLVLMAVKMGVAHLATSPK